MKNEQEGIVAAGQVSRQVVAAALTGRVVDHANGPVVAALNARLRTAASTLATASAQLAPRGRGAK